MVEAKMTAYEIVDLIEERLHELDEIQSSALDHIMDTKTDLEMLSVYKERYNTAFDRMIELRRLLRAICDVKHDADLF